MTLRWKLTLLYTFFMMILTAAMLGILLSLSSSAILDSAHRELKEQVWEAFDDLEWEDGELKIDSDFLEPEDGIYLSVYDADGKQLGGRVPGSFKHEEELSEGLKKISLEGEEWYVLDAVSEIESYGSVFIRGIVSVSKEESSLNVTLRLSMILFPLMVLLTAGLGYVFLGHALRPVAKITDTACEIYEKGDLSKRIGLNTKKKDSDAVRNKKEKTAKCACRSNLHKDEIYKLAETFDRMLERLEYSFEKEKQFTSDVSHELRTPVSVILSQCEYLLEDQNLSEEEEKAVQIIQRKAQNMANMTAQLLFLARADQNRQVVKKEWLNLSMVTEMAVEEQQEIAREKGIQIETQIEEDVEGYADETMFIRLWMNLIGNAVTYGKEGGWIRVGIEKQDKKVTGYVEDNGIGIEEEKLPYIWERFYQADTSRSEKGSGLGLAMAKWIVEAHGGTISAKSVYGKGTTFLFEFPTEK
ncbi:MAG: ATP-binding protein [Eubacteriales bacterium]|nr:ATP-binding protein [Eubacteriales bacterium]